MKKNLIRVVQLFNTGPQNEGCPAPTFEVINAMTRSEISLKTIHPFGSPWNPFHKSHNAFRGLDFLRALRVLLCERQADLICAHLESAVFLLLLRRLFLFSVPILIWEVPWSPGWRYREFLTGIAVPRADHCVVFSKNQIELIHRKYGGRVPVSFVPFCVDTDFYSPQPSPNQGEPFVWSCGLDAGRDFLTLIEASRDLNIVVRIKAGCSLGISKAEHPNVVEERHYLVPAEFRRRYSDAAVVVVATKVTPNASGVTSLMESFAMGRPTVVTDNPALRDYFPSSDGAMVVPVGDSIALKAAISDLLQNPSLAETMGRNARKFAEHFLSRAHHDNERVKVFLAAIRGRKARDSTKEKSE